METKQCTICKLDIELTIDNFKQTKYINKIGDTKIYWCSYCRNCQNSKTNEWHKNNKDKCRKNEKKYRDSHLKEVELRKSSYKKKNKTKIALYHKNYRNKNKEKQQKQGRERYANDIVFRLRKIVNRSVQKAISKNGSIIKHLPYSFQELKQHLEKQFEPWMNWNNHGSYGDTWDDSDSTTWKWNIDHVIPQSDLPYMSMTDDNFKKCWALENLRPLSAKQNVIDGVSRVRHQQIKR